MTTFAVASSVIDIGGNYQDYKYEQIVYIFVSFHGDLESKGAIGKAKKYPDDHYANQSYTIANILLQLGLV